MSLLETASTLCCSHSSIFISNNLLKIKFLFNLNKNEDEPLTTINRKFLEKMATTPRRVRQRDPAIDVKPTIQL